KIVAVHTAKGGQQISYFAPNSNNNNMYPVIVEKYNKCLDYLEENPNFTVGKKYYVMFQGESDSLASNTMATTSKHEYKQTYMSFHNAVKQECGFEFGALIQTGRNSNVSFEGIIEIAQAKNELAFEHDDIIMLDQEPIKYFNQNLSYMMGDNIHYNKEGLRKVATDSCAALVNYLGYGDEDKAGVDPVEYLPMPNEVVSFELPSTMKMYLSFATIQEVNYTFVGTQFFINSGVSNIPAVPASIQPVDSRIVWASSDESTATVDNGIITAKKTGQVTITAYPLNHKNMSSTMTVEIKQDRAKTEYRWDFDGNVDGTKKVKDDNGNVTNTTTVAGTKQDTTKNPTISGGKYVATTSNCVGWDISETITLRADEDWSLEWYGQSAVGSGYKAGILVSNDSTYFITYQFERGIFTRFGGDTTGLKFLENHTKLSEIFKDNKWELRHSKEDNIVTLYLNGEVVTTRTWRDASGNNVNMVINSLLGRRLVEYGSNSSFVGELDYMQITIWN
ncbi:MAG: Ig-like domain-containing protein, partial [Clostridia bacterium]|nr:Ig-like domain-containing protein [Clostridia bacterium]